MAYPNNHIPSTSFDPAAVNFEKFFPTATSDAGAGKIGNLVNYFSATQNYFDEYNAHASITTFGSRDHLFGHYFYDWYTSSRPFSWTRLICIATRRISKPATIMHCSLRPTHSRRTF